MKIKQPTATWFRSGNLRKPEIADEYLAVEVTLRDNYEKLRVVLHESQWPIAGLIVRGFLFRMGYSNSSEPTGTVNGQPVDLEVFSCPYFEDQTV